MFKQNTIRYYSSMIDKDSQQTVQGDVEQIITDSTDQFIQDGQQTITLDLEDLMDEVFPKAKPSTRIRLSTMMPSTRNALLVLNRVFNYATSEKNVMVTGAYGTGKSYLLDAWTSNQRSLPKMPGRRMEIRRYDKNAMKDILWQYSLNTDSACGSNLMISLFKNLESKCLKSTHTKIVLIIDDADLAATIVQITPGIPLIVKASNYSANKFVIQCKSAIDSFEIVNLDSFAPTWKELSQEVVNVNKRRFLPMCNDGLDGDLVLEFMRTIWKLASQQTRQPRAGDVINISVGRFIDLLEKLHAKLIEQKDITLTKPIIRKLTTDLYDEQPNVMTYEGVVTVDSNGQMASLSAPESTESENLVWMSDSVQEDDDELEDETGDDDELIPKRSERKTTLTPYSDVKTLGDRLRSKIVNQDKAIDTVVDSIKIDAAGLRTVDRPIGVYLFEGPSGVGKTALASQLAGQLYEKPVNFIRLDMGEYSTEESAVKLFGSAVGYQDSKRGGQLTNAVMRDPQTVILFDEAEKAHSKVWDSLLQVFDGGRMTDGLGHVVDFTHTIIVLTSNLGNNEVQRNKSGFGDSNTDSVRDYKAITRKATEKYFRIELLNRIDAVVMFNRLRPIDLERILKMQLDAIAVNVAKNHPDLTLKTTLDAKTKDWILSQSESAKYGARELQRTVRRLILLPMADWLINRDSNKKSTDRYILTMAYNSKTNAIQFIEKKNSKDGGLDA